MATSEEDHCKQGRCVICGTNNVDLKELPCFHETCYNCLVRFQREQKISAYQIQCPDKKCQQKFSVQPGALAAFKGDWNVMIIESWYNSPFASCRCCRGKCQPLKLSDENKCTLPVCFIVCSAMSHYVEGHLVYKTYMTMQVSIVALTLVSNTDILCALLWTNNTDIIVCETTSMGHIFSGH